MTIEKGSYSYDDAKVAVGANCTKTSDETKIVVTYTAPSYGGGSPATPTPSMSNFKKDAALYSSGMYTDVPADAWYGNAKEGSVKNATMLGIMVGYGDKIFNPDGMPKLSEAIKMACVVHSIYNANGEKFTQVEPWYQVCVDYSVSNGIIKSGDFADYNAVCTRAQASAVVNRLCTVSERLSLSFK